MAAPLRRARRQADDGFIVVAVLWILGALATFASIYAVYVANTAVGLRVNDDRLQAEALVSGALELTAYRLTAIKGEAPTRGAFAFRAGSATVAVEFRSEAARIDLNAAPKKLLAGLFTTLGAQPAEADYYADRIVGWRTKADPEAVDNEAAAYRTAGLPYKPRQAPFANVGELWLVLGLPQILAERALPFVTVFSGRPEINVADAAPEVIAALPGMTPDRLYAVLNRRAAAPQNAQSAPGPSDLPDSDQAGLTTQGSKSTRVTVHVGLENGRRINAEAVILVLDDAGEPFRVLSWRDDFDGSF